MVVVASGEPGTPVRCWAAAAVVAAAVAAAPRPNCRLVTPLRAMTLILQPGSHQKLRRSLVAWRKIGIGRVTEFAAILPLGKSCPTYSFAAVKSWPSFPGPVTGRYRIGWDVLNRRVWAWLAQVDPGLTCQQTTPAECSALIGRDTIVTGAGGGKSRCGGGASGMGCLLALSWSA